MEFAYQVSRSIVTGSVCRIILFMEIASFLCLYQVLKSQEYYPQLEAKRLLQWAVAAASDAQNRPQTNEVVIPVIDKRQITGIIGPAIG